MVSYINYTLMSFPDDTTKAAIDVDAKLLKWPKIDNLLLAAQFLVIEIYSKESKTTISPGQKAFITIILEQCNMQNAQDVSTGMDWNSSGRGSEWEGP